mmetsp:Transcript_85523/g.238699  ORF Transcript_85523/g.238699 Transcript_85523/m.238699 type:complete len:265 (+) Transcript_85523:59-853(+)
MQHHEGPHRHRSRSRSADGHRFTFGRYQGQRYRDIHRGDPGYCQWALRVRHPSGALRDFIRWLRRQDSQREASRDSSEDSESDGIGDLQNSFRSLRDSIRALRDFEVRIPDGVGEDSDSDDGPEPRGDNREAHSNAPGVEASSQSVPRSRADATLERLPRIAYSAELFSGSPHPDSCPVCMEDFGADGREIVLTPCLHVFHAPCLGSWLSRRSDCPSCRWDIRDTGERKALGSSVISVLDSAAAAARAVAAMSEAVVVSDDSDG